MIIRTLEVRLKSLARQFPVLFCTGPRQSGKTTLTRMAFPDFDYLSLEDLQNRQEATEDPRGFLRRLEGATGVILDEVQRTPDLFSYIQGFVDDARGGPLLLTGSQHFLLSERISQSLAGRAAILELLPFSLSELAGRPAIEPEAFGQPALVARSPHDIRLDDVLFTGLFPPIHDRQLEAAVWLDGYIRTYVERDVRSISNVGDLDAFTRFLGLCAGRTGQLLNLSSLGADAGVSHATAKRWISILRASYVVDLLGPHHQSFAKRLTRSPKLYFVDTGLLCHLLGIRRVAHLHQHPLRGAVFENHVICELRKLFLHHGQRPPLYFWRESGGREIDVIIDYGNQRVPVEIKAGETIASDYFKELDKYVGLSGDPFGVLVHGGDACHPRKRHVVYPWWACS